MLAIKMINGNFQINRETWKGIKDEGERIVRSRKKFDIKPWSIELNTII